MAEPFSGKMRVESTLRSVVFPAPLGPKIPKILPLAREKETSSSAQNVSLRHGRCVARANGARTHRLTASRSTMYGSRDPMRYCLLIPTHSTAVAFVLI